MMDYRIVNVEMKRADNVIHIIFTMYKRGNEKVESITKTVTIEKEGDTDMVDSFLIVDGVEELANKHDYTMHCLLNNQGLYSFMVK